MHHDRTEVNRAYNITIYLNARIDLIKIVMRADL